MTLRGVLRASRTLFLVITGLWLVRLLMRRSAAPMAPPAPRSVTVSPDPLPPEPPKPPEQPTPPFYYVTDPVPVDDDHEPEHHSRWAELRYPLLVSLAILILAGVFWYVQFRPRADASDIQQHVALVHPGSTIGCSQDSANGSKWTCAVVYRAESTCLTVSVSPLGRVSPGRLTTGRCATPVFTGMLPKPVTRDLVAADVLRHAGKGTAYTCAKIGGSGVRWACARELKGTIDCRTLRVVPWTPIHLHPGAAVCKSVPYLRSVTG